MDATGADVSTGPDLVVFDEAGIGWNIDPTTSWVAAVPLAPSFYYTTFDCSGEALLHASAVAVPRVAMVLNEQYVVTPDQGVQRDVCAAAMSVRDRCMPIEPNVRCDFVRASDLVAIEEPTLTLPGVPPYRPTPN